MADTPPVPPSKIVPSPPAVHISTTYWKAGRVLHRIHPVEYASNAFNPGKKGNARFNPIKNAEGELIPTMYGGDSFDCAAMETVFHDVPFAAGFKPYAKNKLEGLAWSQLAPTADLLLADLSNVALRKLGVERNQLIDTERDTYPDSRRSAEQLHEQNDQLQGLCWISPPG
jgi:hypothetical protein